MKPQTQSLREQKAELREAIRVNEGLLCEQRANVDMLASRLQGIAFKQAELDSLKVKYEDAAVLAPSRIPVIEATLAKQRAALAKLEEPVFVPRAKDLLEVLGKLFANPATVGRAQALLKGLNAGKDLNELWREYGNK